LAWAKPEALSRR